MLLASIQAANLMRYGLVCSRCRGRGCVQIGGVDIILASNPNQGEEGIAPGIGQRRAHPVWRRRLADGADRPV